MQQQRPLLPRALCLEIGGNFPECSSEDDDDDVFLFSVRGKINDIDSPPIKLKHWIRTCYGYQVLKSFNIGTKRKQLNVIDYCFRMVFYMEVS